MTGLIPISGGIHPGMADPAPPAPPAPLSPALLAFLRDLADHNDRAWFAAERPRYERDLRRPLLAWIAAIKPLLAEALPDVVADPRPVGGSMFRLHRDTRFSADKLPYKTNAGAQFRHRDASRDVHMPGLYLHLEPERAGRGCWIGLGIWRPEPAALRRIRAGIAGAAPTGAAPTGAALTGDSARWCRIGDDLAAAGWRRGGGSVKRLPPGFAVDPVDGRLAEELRRTDHLWTLPLSEGEVCDPGFAQAFAARAGEGAAAIRWLAERCGLAGGEEGAGAGG